MFKTSTLLLTVIFLTSKAQDASAEEVGAYVPFIAVDTVNGSFGSDFKDQMDKSNVEYKFLVSPITSEQLEGANIFLILGNFRGQMTMRKDHRLYTNKEIATISNFVKKGGVLIGAGIAWNWERRGLNKKDYPLNQIGEALDFELSGKSSFDRFEKGFLSMVPNPKINDKSVFTNVTIKGSNDKLVRLDKGYGGAGAKRGEGYIYIFGNYGIIYENPEFVSSVFHGLSAQIQPNKNLAENDPTEPETEKQQEVAPAIEPIPKVAASNINPLDLLTQEGSNMIAWVTSPLHVDIPDNFRANISLLREDLLDGHAKGSASPEIYQSAVELCNNLIVCIDMKEKQQIDAKLRVSQAKQRSPLSNQALEARRNYLMSWPQYHREVRQREVLAEKKADTTDVKASELELAWIETAGKLRRALDVKYSAYRAALRKK